MYRAPLGVLGVLTRCSLAAVVLVALGACSADAGDDPTGTSEDALVAGAGGGPAVWESDPCADPRHFAQAHGYNLVEAAQGEHTIHGTAGRDLIVGTDGDDVISAGAGDDIVCAGYGEDVVRGEAGDDYIDGGGDNDHLYGDEGNDVIHGRGGSDVIFGGANDDQLFGDILDDTLHGDDGDDLLIGGHGTDTLDGGRGNDFMRGDTGNDSFDGGPGRDVASFATAMPPGVGKSNDSGGVKVDFTDDCRHAGGRHDGCANGDGGNEPLDGVEVVIGSPYDDVLLSGGAHVTFVPSFGDDRCDGQACGKPRPAGSEGEVLVAVDPVVRDTGLEILGTNGNEALDVFADGHEVRVRSTNGDALAAGDGCRRDGGEVRCSFSHTLRWLAAFAGGGDDVVKLGEAVGREASPFPRDFTAHVAGGEGSDWLHGGDEQDVLFSGPTGADHLFGNAGDDALLSESRKYAPKDCSALSVSARAADPRCDENKPDAAHYTDGRDELYGGPGDDQLVADYPCGRHFYSGGEGKDIAGFARSGRFDITAQLGGAAAVVKDFHGRAFNPQLCGKDDGTRMLDDLEILEASDGNDELWGNDQPNVVWGREGDDRIHGLGGDDFLAGLLGNDTLYGGAGNDVLQGGGGDDRIFQDAN